MRANDTNKYEYSRKGFSAVGVVIIIAVVLLIGGGVWYLEKIQNKQSNTIAIPASISTDTINRIGATPTIDVPNWKTYRNEEYGFSFEYPPYLDLRETSSAERKLSEEQILSLEPLDAQKYEGNVNIYLVRQRVGDYKFKDFEGNVLPIEKLKNVKIGNFNFYEISGGEILCWESSDYLPRENTMFKFSIGGCGEDGRKVVPLEKILETLKFTK